MSRSSLIKIVISLLFALAVALGLVQRAQNPYDSFSPLSQSDQRELLSFYQKGLDLAPKPQESKTTAEFLAVGDIMLSRNVAGTIQKSGDVLLPFSGMKDILNSTDFNFGNLESPISGNNSFNPAGSMVFNAPPSYTAGLKTYNFKILNLANNHAFDQGLSGLEYTIKHLDGLGIKHIGAGKTLTDAWKPAIVETRGMKICFIGASYASINDSGKTKNNYVARIEDMDNFKLQISNIKSSCDFIVATMHAGTEYTTKPNQAQIDFARAAIDSGADMVIGAHPHWVQTIEKYKDKYIFYSLGNFIFDQEWSRETKEGLALKIQISNSKFQNSLQGPKTPATLEQIELIPLIIENYSTPRPANEEETKKILQKIGEKHRILK